MNFSDLVGKREGSGSNNTMSLWTWPWTKSRRLLRRSPRHQQPLANSTATKYNKCALVVLLLLFGLFYWEESSNADYLYMIDVETRQAAVTAKANNNHENNNDNDNTLSLAVLVAGSTQRFLFDSFVEHVVANNNSNNNNKINLDYFAILSLKSGPAFRQDAGYMGHLAGRDKLFEGILEKNNNSNSNSNSAAATTNRVETIRTQMMEAMVAAAAAIHPNNTNNNNNNVHIRALRLLEEPIEDDPILDQVRTHQEKLLQQTFPSKDDVFQQFPMMDKRKKDRTKTGNKNMIRLFLALESLWDTEFLEHESSQQQQQQQRGDDNNNDNGKPYWYDYVLILRDDTLWLDDFDLHRVIATDPTADAYILSCDARQPKMLPPEINDHGILIRRSKAAVVGKYVSAMVALDLQDCHDSVTQYLGTERGCNSEMILKHVLEAHQIRVKLVPQSVLPFERAVLINNDGGDFYCYHKFCQSVDQPLTLPTGIQTCKDLNF